MTNSGSIALSEITNGNNYYLAMNFQGKLNLDWYDYGARLFDPALGRFTTIDPWAEKYNFQSPYLYALNNPIRFTDFLGLGANDEVETDEQKKAREAAEKKAAAEAAKAEAEAKRGDIEVAKNITQGAELLNDITGCVPGAKPLGLIVTGVSIKQYYSNGEYFEAVAEIVSASFHAFYKPAVVVTVPYKIFTTNEIAATRALAGAIYEFKVRQAEDRKYGTQFSERNLNNARDAVETLKSNLKEAKK